MKRLPNTKRLLKTFYSKERAINWHNGLKSTHFKKRATISSSGSNLFLKMGDNMKKHQFIWAAALMLATTASGARGDEKSAVAALEKMRDDGDTRLTITRDENRP